MVSVERLKDLVTQRATVKVFSAASGDHLMGEGVVIAMCEAPSFCVENADGERSWHSAQLPVKVRVETWQPL